MKYEYKCECGKTLAYEVSLSLNPEYEPEQEMKCSCGKIAQRQFGFTVGVQDNRDQMKNVGTCLSSQRGIEFIGRGYPDAERKLDLEEQEISKIMDEPVTSYDIAAGNEQMTNLEQERGKPKGFYSGNREQTEVEKVNQLGEKQKVLETKRRGAEALKDDVEKSRLVRGVG
jgi:hypothetical protein